MRRRHALGLLAGAGALSAHEALAQTFDNIRLLAPFQDDVGTSPGPLRTTQDLAGIMVMVLSDGHDVWFGTNSSVSATTGWPLSDREWRFFNVRNANELYAVCPTSPSARVVGWPFVPY